MQVAVVLDEVPQLPPDAELRFVSAAPGPVVAREGVRC
jgi:hypothetical protein